MAHNIKAVGFLLMVLVPILGPAGFLLGAPWLAPLVIFVVVPAADWVVGEDRTNIATRDNRWPVYFWLVPHLYVWTWLACLAWTAAKLEQGVGVGDAIGLLVGAGIGSAFATCAAHELLHRGLRADFWTSRVVMSLCAYGHFVIEHLHHHATVGKPECGTVPLPGEAMWHFVVRNALFGYRNAYQVAERMRQRRGLPWFANRVVQQHALTVLLMGGFALAWGASGVLLFFVQAVVAIFTVELVQYCEHYGLVRAEGEEASVRHAWNSNGWVTNAITLNITRHSEHHLAAHIPYQRLRTVPEAPHTPMGYFGLTWLALFPAIWRRRIDPARARHIATAD